MLSVEARNLSLGMRAELFFFCVRPGFQNWVVEGQAYLGQEKPTFQGFLVKRSNFS